MYLKKVIQYEDSVYDYKLEGLPDRFKEEELQNIVSDPQNRIEKVQTFTVSKLIKPVIKDNKEYYEVQWKGYREQTLDQEKKYQKICRRW